MALGVPPSEFDGMEYAQALEMAERLVTFDRERRDADRELQIELTKALMKSNATRAAASL